MRWLVRALLVIAGAVLGTAAAWLIGDATASAAQLAPAPADVQTGDDDATPFTDRVVAASDDLTWGASDLVGNATATALKYGMAGGPADPARGEEAAADMRQTVHSFTRDAVLHPVERTLGTAEHISRKPQDAPQVIGQALAPQQGVTGIKKVWEFLHPSGKSLIKLPGLTGDSADQPAALPAPQAPPVALAVVGPVAKATAGGVRHDAAGVSPSGKGGDSRHGDQHGGSPYSPLHGPLAPVGVPALPGGATTTGGHIDGLLFGVPAGGPAVRGTDDRTAVRFAFRHTPVQPGEQPGVTPD
ncbi:hypothetical protein [Amycolatopsis thermophila]|uniref:Uncharacterized protein n=1 Tax=Amycolatopsis thermophila TaxID=206084 RepID=A0ABU0ESI0_9PSEU|nr:hypothetical protein [Amycolatopsis thermophila]MDQ0378258.1 hypothetical protein [Amycolatopsis thermophila]